MNFENQTRLDEILTDHRDVLIKRYSNFKPHPKAFQNYDTLKEFVNSNQVDTPSDQVSVVLDVYGKPNQEHAPSFPEKLCLLFMTTFIPPKKQVLISQISVPVLGDLICRPAQLLRNSGQNASRPSYFPLWIPQPFLKFPGNYLFYDHISIDQVGMVAKGMTAACSIFRSYDDAKESVIDSGWALTT